MVVLHVIGWISTGGSQNLVLRHLAELSQRYPEITNILCVLTSESAVEQAYLDLLPSNTRFLNQNPDYRKPWVLLAGVGKLAALIWRERVDIVHSYLFSADLLASIAVRITGRRHVAHVLDRRGSRKSVSVRERLRVRMVGGLLRRRKTLLVAVSEACRQHAITEYCASPNRTLTAHNGIDPPEFNETENLSTDGPTVIGTIGRIAPEKGLETLIQAARLINSVRVDVRWLFAGPGSDAADVKEMLILAGVSERFELLGRVPAVNDFYRSISIMVVPSVAAEGLPTTILEAMANGVPVVATDLGGAAEVIESGVSGILVEPGDPRKLADAILLLAESSERRAAISREARLRVSTKFTTRAMTESIVTGVYQRASR